MAAQLTRGEPGDVDAVKVHLAAVGSFSADHESAQGRLSAAGFSDDSERLTVVYVQCHLRDRLHRCRVPAPPGQAVPDRVLTHNLPQGQQRCWPVATVLEVLAGGLDDLCWGRSWFCCRSRKRADGKEASVCPVAVGRERWCLLLADISGVLTTRCEAATACRHCQIWWRARDSAQRRRAIRAQGRDCLQQRSAVWMTHPGTEPVRRRCLHQPAGIHHHHAIRPPGHNAHVVGHEQQPHAKAFFHLLQQAEDLILDGDVKRGGGLICYQELWPAGRSHCDRDSLTLAAGELMGVASEAFNWSWHPYTVEQLSRPGQRGSARHPVVLFEWLCQLPADSHRRVEGTHRILENYRYLRAPYAAHLLARQLRQVRALESHAARYDPDTMRQQPYDRQSGHGFARSALPHQAGRLTSRDSERGVLHRACDPIAVGDFGGQAADIEENIICWHDVR